MRSRNITIAASAALIGAVAGIGLASADASSESLEEAVAGAEANVSLTDAIAIAAKEIGGGALVDYELDVEDGALSYLVEIENADGLHEVEVDGRTGVVKEIDTD